LIACFSNTDFKKKLYLFRPGRCAAEIETCRTRLKVRLEPADPCALERGVRQLLADKVSGNMLGLWLLIPEYLRLGIWDLLTRWIGQTATEVGPRLALQLVNEAALCVTGLRRNRCLSQKGFELAQGLPFVGSDQAMHELLAGHTVAEAEALQVQLGLVRRARQHFKGTLLAIDPHRMRSYSKRQMIRFRGDEHSRPVKVSPTFFCLDADTHQPVCFTTAVSAQSVAQATPELLRLSAAILNPRDTRPLVLADTEHYTADLFAHVRDETPFELLAPMPRTASLLQRLHAIPASAFHRAWVGYATAVQEYHFQNSPHQTYFQYIQRGGERSSAYDYKAFLGTARRDDVDDLTINFPKRWHIEEFFNAYQALGWNRAGTMNLNIRYGQMSAALVAQSALCQFRQRLGQPYADWDATHMANSVFQGLNGDLQVERDTIYVTFYNAPNVDRLREHYEKLPAKLQQEGVNPRIHWLYNYKLDFRFR